MPGSKAYRKNAIVFAALLASSSSYALAAESGNAVEEVIVTANKRSESVNKVGMSITAVSGESLLNAGVTDPSQLAKVVPGFYYTKSLYGTSVFAIRGIGFNNTALGLSPTVSVYVDEVPLSYPAMTGGVGLDIERIEALKGPQGVLFGNNSTGGAINYIAASPTSEPHAGATLSYSRFGKFEGEGYLTGPLSKTLLARLALRIEDGGAWQVSRTRPGEHLGDARKISGRFTLDWKGPDRLSLRLSASAWRDRSDTLARQAVAIRPLISGSLFALPDLFFVPPQFVAAFAPPSGKAREADWDPGDKFRNDNRFFQTSLRANYEVSDKITLTSITAFSSLTPYSRVDQDGLSYPASILIQRGKIDSFFQELRADTHLTSRLSLLLGVNFSQDKIEDDLAVDSNTTVNNALLGAPHGVENTRVDTNVKTYAAFAKLDYQLTDTLKLIAAARYTDDRRNSAICSYDVSGEFALLQNILTGSSIVPGGCLTETNGVPGVFRGSLNEDNVSWRFGGEWQATPDLLLYATVNRGYKSGGFPNLFALNSVQLKPVVQEKLDAYEIGAKVALLDHRLQLNGAIFHYDYTNKQIQGRVIVPPLGPLESLVNIPSATADGAELQLTAMPVNGLTLGLGATLVSTKIGDGIHAYTPFGVLADISGEEFPGTPKWQVNADVNYERPVGRGLVASGGVSAVYTAATNWAFGKLPELAAPGYVLVDARAGIGSEDERWRLSFNVRNLTDKNYYYASIQTIDVLNRYYGQPRTYGVTLQVKY